MSIRSPRLRATLYSLPVPITIALIAGSPGPAGGQYLGVVLLVAFMYVVAVLRDPVGRLRAVAGALLLYIGIAAASHRWVDLPAWEAFALAVLLLASVRVWHRLRPSKSPDAPAEEPPGVIAYGTVPLVTAGTWALGAILGPFLVTFPYSGVPTALAMRSGWSEFADSFANHAWLLLAFLGVFHVAQEYLPALLALGIAWAMFTTALLWMSRRRPTERSRAIGGTNDSQAR